MRSICLHASLCGSVQDEALGLSSGNAAGSGGHRAAPCMGADARPIALGRGVPGAYPVDGARGYLRRHVAAYIATTSPPVAGWMNG